MRLLLTAKIYCFLSLFSQLKLYTEDFDRECVAREEAVKVKNIVEENLQKDREITSLREQLNMHARQQVRWRTDILVTLSDSSQIL